MLAFVPKLSKRNIVNKASEGNKKLIPLHVISYQLFLTLFVVVVVFVFCVAVGTPFLFCFFVLYIYIYIGWIQSLNPFIFVHRPTCSTYVEQ